MNFKKVVFYVRISSVCIKQTEHNMAAWGYEFYLLVLKVSLTRSLRFAHSWEILSALEDKIRIPKRPCNVRFSRSIFLSDRFSYFLYDLLSDFSSEFLSISWPFLCQFFFPISCFDLCPVFVLFFVRTLDTAHRTSRSDIGHQNSGIRRRTSYIGQWTSDIKHRISNVGRRTSDMGH